MSRLRKGIKYNGGNFAESFKSMVKGGDSPFAVITPGMTDLLEDTNDEDDRPMAVATNREKDASTDLIPSDTDYSRSEVGDFFQRVKLAEEKDALEALKNSMNEEEEASEEYDPEYRDEDGNLIYTDDYDMNMTGKERRKEKRENRREIRESGLKGAQKRAAKKANRSQNKAARQDAKCIKLKSKGKTHKSFYRKNCM
tara:strand:- start:454 stop:1047 length:594 start_codon:yes stop_codon:yes gene_type:complete